MKHINQKNDKDNKVEIGIDLREYYPSVEWDILGVPAERHEKYYPCCAEPYPGIWNKSIVLLLIVSILIFRYILQHNAPKEDFILYRQFNYTMRWNFIPVGLGILPTCRLGREDCSLHQHSAIPDHVLLAYIRNYTFYVVGPASFGEVSAIHYDTRRAKCSDNNYYTQHTLS